MRAALERIDALTLENEDLRRRLRGEPPTEGERLEQREMLRYEVMAARLRWVPC